MLRAINEATLTQQIIDYRIRHNIPVGDVTRDIDNFFCGESLDNCTKEPSDYTPGAGPSPDPTPMLSRVTRWTSMAWAKRPRGGYPLATEAEAARRFAICEKCPKYEPWKHGCMGCINPVSNLLIQIRALRRGEPNSKGCAVLGFDCGTAANMELDTVAQMTDEQRHQLPDACWALRK
jgi:hypothetical protein